MSDFLIRDLKTAAERIGGDPRVVQRHHVSTGSLEAVSIRSRLVGRIPLTSKIQIAGRRLCVNVAERLDWKRRVRSAVGKVT